MRILALQNNNLEKIFGLDDLESLEELYLSTNKISEIEGLDNNLNLKTLDLSSNRISQIRNVRHLSNLEEFWLNGNQLTNFEDLEELYYSSKLRGVYFEGNPWSSNPRYVAIVRQYLPQIRQIDAAIIQW